MSILGTHSTIGSARRSACTIEYGVSEFGVGIAVSFGVKVWLSFQIWLNGVLYCDDDLSTLNSTMAL